ncbi:MAG: DUF748 domain-containing protein, partial [Bacteroidetes bacterium]|nr:DUF748 domain-containing protein [Bacteroidota bacterium]
KPKKSSAREPKSRRQQKKPSKNWLWLGLLGGVIIIYGVIGFLGIPYYLTNVFPTRYYQNTRILFEAENIHFNPFTFTFAADKIHLTDGEGREIIGIKSLVSSLRLFSLLRRDLVCNEITIEEPEVHLIRNKKGEYNITKIFGSSGGGDATDIMQFSDLPFFFSLNNIRVRNGQMVFEDMPASKTHTVEKVQFDLPTFSNIPIKSTSHLTPNFSATINGSPIQLTGKTKTGDISDSEAQVSELTCALNNIDLQSYLTYLPVELPFDIKKGTANGTVNLIFDSAASKGNKFSFGFELQLTESELISKNDTLRSQIPSALLTGDILPVSKTLSFSKIVLHKPILNSYGQSLLSNLGDLLTQETALADPLKPANKPISLYIHSLAIADGHLSHFKKKKDKKAIAEWKSLKLNINGYSSDDKKKQGKEPGNFHFSGKQENSSAYFTWDGNFHEEQRVSGNFKIANYSASTFFKNLGFDDFNNVNGDLNAKGQLDLFLEKGNSTKLQYHLNKTELSIKKFKLTNNKKTVLTAQVVKSGALRKTDENLNLGALSIIDGSLSLVKGNLPGFFKKFSQKNSKYTVNSLSFSGKASVQSSTKPKRILMLTDLMLKADSLNNAKSNENNLELKANSASGGSINAQGTVAIKPFALLSDIKFSRVRIENLLPFWTKANFLQNTTGYINGDGKFELPKFRFIGGLQTSEIAIDSTDFPKLAWQDATFSDLNFSSKPFHLGLSDVTIKNPKMDWSYTSFTGNPLVHLRSFLRSHFLPDNSSSKSSKKKISVAQLNIQNITFSDGIISVIDQRLTPPWKTGISNFSGTLANIHSSKTAKMTSFNFTGNLDEAPFAVSGDTNIFGDKVASNYSITLSDYPLSLFTEQLVSKNDIDISRTKFALSVKSKTEIDMTQTEGEITLKGIRPVSSTVESAISLAMLTDADNLISLDYNFVNRATDKNPALFSQLNRLFDTKIIKGSVSPLLLANGDFTDLIDNEFVEFTPGEFMLTDDGRDMLLRYTALLIAHPKIGLELSGGYDNKKDLDAIKEQLINIEQKRVGAINEKLYSEWETQNKAYEQKLAEQKKNLQQGNTITEIDMPKSLMDGYTPVEPVPVSVDNTMLLELADKRLEIIHQFFTTQLSLEAGRLTVIPPENQDIKADRVRNGVTIFLQPIKF